MNSETVSSSSLRGSSDRCHWVATPRRRPRGDFRCVVVVVVLTRCAALGLIWFLILIHFDRVFLSCFFFHFLSLFYRVFTELTTANQQTKWKKKNPRSEPWRHRRPIKTKHSKKKKSSSQKKKEHNGGNPSDVHKTWLVTRRTSNVACFFLFFLPFRFVSFLSFVCYFHFSYCGWRNPWKLNWPLNGSCHWRTMTSPADNDVTSGQWRHPCRDWSISNQHGNVVVGQESPRNRSIVDIVFVKLITSVILLSFLFFILKSNQPFPFFAFVSCVTALGLRNEKRKRKKGKKKKGKEEEEEEEEKEENPKRPRDSPLTSDCSFFYFFLFFVFCFFISFPFLFSSFCCKIFKKKYFWFFFQKKKDILGVLVAGSKKKKVLLSLGDFLFSPRANRCSYFVRFKMRMMCIFF